MELLNRRISSGPESTLGTLFEIVDTGQSEHPRFICYLLEDQYNEPKVPGETRIPPGRYEITLRTEGGMHPRYAKRFPEFHRGMFWLRDVPGFKFVYVHTGNDDDDSEGCLLTGEGQRQNVTERGKVTSSVSAYKRFAELVHAAYDRGERVFITVEDYA